MTVSKEGQEDSKTNQNQAKPDSGTEVKPKKSRREILLEKQAKILQELKELNKKDEQKRKRETDQNRRKLFAFIEAEGLGGVPFAIWQDWIRESKTALLARADMDDGKDAE